MRATQCCLAATRMHSWPTHCNAPLSVNVERVDHNVFAASRCLDLRLVHVKVIAAPKQQGMQ
jgi:hypothetical protein